MAAAVLVGRLKMRDGRIVGEVEEENARMIEAQRMRMAGGGYAPGRNETRRNDEEREGENVLERELMDRFKRASDRRWGRKPAHDCQCATSSRDAAQTPMQRFKAYSGRYRSKQ